MGGTVTGEHGVGIEKLGSMCVQFSAEEHAQMRALKAAFDSRELLNPGNVIPTLQRCSGARDQAEQRKREEVEAVEIHVCAAWGGLCILQPLNKWHLSG